ncbi:MAG: energy-coupling factor transporter transmembrane component T family protein [Candidatus Ranarchaeia archaeon]|jgi:energy-coupling factor transporter transmembrane protein EcfT
MSFMVELLRGIVDLTLYESSDEFYYRLNPIPKGLWLFAVFLVGLGLSGLTATPDAMRAGAYYMTFFLIFSLLLAKAIAPPVIEQFKRNRTTIIFVVVFIGLGNFLLGAPWKGGWDYLLWYWPNVDPVSGATIPASSGFFIMSDLGLMYGWSKTIYLLCVMVAGIMLFKATNPRDMMNALEKNIKLPYKVSFFTSMFLRFVPLVADEMFLTFNAHAVRGLELEGGRLTTRLRNFMTILAPLFIDVLKISNRMGVVLQARGFKLDAENRTTIFETKFRGIDWLFMGLIVLMFYWAIFLMGTGGLDWFISLDVPFLHPHPDSLFGIPLIPIPPFTTPGPLVPYIEIPGFYMLEPTWIDLAQYGIDWPPIIKDLWHIFFPLG